MKILDASCSVKGMWYQKNNPHTVFFDKRREKIRMPCGDNYRLVVVNPDIIGNWRSMPFKSESFDMVLWDPPFIIRRKGIIEGAITKKYGILYKESWKEDLRLSALELFRILRPEGTFILKWGDSGGKKKDEILKLMPYAPMFGSVAGNKGTSHWILFIKYQNNKSLDEYNG